MEDIPAIRSLSYRAFGHGSFFLSHCPEISRELPAGERATVTMGSVSSGEAYNIIPDEVVMRGTMRTYDENIREFVKKRIIEIAQGTATAFRAEAVVSFDRGCPTLVNDKNLSCHIEKTMIELLGDKKVFTTNELSNGKIPEARARKILRMLATKYLQLCWDLWQDSMKKAISTIYIIQRLNLTWRL